MLLQIVCIVCQSDMLLSTYAKQRIISLHEQGLKSPTITKLLKQEGVSVSRIGVYKFLKTYKLTKTIQRWEGLSSPSKITA